MLVLQSALPKGEVYIGHSDSGFSIGNNPRSRGDPLEFVLDTGGREFHLRAENIQDKERWISALQTVISTPQTPQDIKSKHLSHFC